MGTMGKGGVMVWICIFPKQRQLAHKPCLARAAVTSWASVESWGDSRRLMLPEEDRRGEVPPVSMPGEWVTMISAPWSTRALAESRKFSLWLSIWWAGEDGLGQRSFSSLTWTDSDIWYKKRLPFTIMFPPPGVWLVFSRELTLAWAFSLKSSFTLSIRTCPPPGNRTARRRREVLNPRGIARLQDITSPRQCSGQKKSQSAHCTAWKRHKCQLWPDLYSLYSTM